MEIIKKGTNIDFIGKRYIAFTLSALMILIGIISLIVHGGPKYGIDFAGGTLIQIKFGSPVEIDRIKAGLSAATLENASVQLVGDKKENEFLIRTNTPIIANK